MKWYNWITTIFDPEEFVCLGVCTPEILQAKVQCKDVYTQEAQKIFPIDNHSWITLNPFKPYSTRSNDNVAAYRNFLIEFDEVPLEVQEKLIEESGIPYTSQVFSGNKSYHFAVSLEEPLQDLDLWKSLWRKIYTALPDMDSKSDRPCAFMRTCWGLNYKTGTQQQLVKLGQRVPNKLFYEWASKYSEREIKTEKDLFEATDSTSVANNVGMSAWTAVFLETGKLMQVDQGQCSRHDSLRNVLLDLKKASFKLDDAVESVIRWESQYNQYQERQITREEIYRLAEWIY